MVAVILPGATEFIEMDETDLIKRVGGHEDENELVNWVEYRLRTDPQGPYVHRSVHLNLKKYTVTGEPVIASLT